VEYGVVLDVGIVANADLVDVAAKDGVHPDAGVLADNDVADELGGVVDIRGAGELGGDAFIGADHGIARRQHIMKAGVGSQVPDRSIQLVS
jgi:hypothetical protein